MKELATILFGTGWTMKKWALAIVAMIAIMLLVCESDSIYWLIGSKVVGCTLIYGCVRVAHVYNITLNNEE